MTAQLEAAVAEHEAARAELGDVLQAWQQDREELAEQIRWAGRGGAGPNRGRTECGMQVGWQYGRPALRCQPELPGWLAGRCTTTWL